MQMRLDTALRQIEDSLAVLSRSGHHFHLEEGHLPHQEYPKYVYHYTRGQKLVRSEWELRDLGPGWFPSMRDAEYAEGIDIQFAGRGGVRRHKQLEPAEAEARFVQSGPTKAELREAFLQQRRRLGDLGPILSDSKV